MCTPNAPDEIIWIVQSPAQRGITEAS